VIFSTDAITYERTVMVKAFTTDVTIYTMNSPGRTVDIADWAEMV
jgi:hypothetical protein